MKDKTIKIRNAEGFEITLHPKDRLTLAYPFTFTFDDGRMENTTFEVVLENVDGVLVPRGPASIGETSRAHHTPDYKQALDKIWL